MRIRGTLAGSRRGPRRGAAAAELAVMLPVLTLLLVIAVDIARLFHAYVTITNCARNGAIWASSPTTAQAQHPQYSSSNTVTQNLQAVGQTEDQPVGVGAGRALAIANAGLINSHRDETRAAGDFIHQLGKTIAPHARLFDRIAT